MPAAQPTPRLPRSSEESAVETRWHAVLALAAALGLGLAIWTSGAMVQNWDQYTAFVQRLVVRD